MTFLLRSCLFFLAMTSILVVSILACAQQADESPIQASPVETADPLIQVLIRKGVLTLQKGQSVSFGAASEQRDRLAVLLQRKGVLSAADLDTLSVASASAQVALALVASTKLILPPEPSSALPATPTPAEEPPKSVPAVAPVRVLQLESSTPKGWGARYQAPAVGLDSYSMAWSRPA